MTVSKTLSWQAAIGTVDHYEIGISTSATGTPTLIKTTTDASTTTTVEYSSSTYPTAWLFVRAVASSGETSDWSDPVSADSLDPTYTPPQPLQYAYANDVKDALIGLTLPSTFTDRVLNKMCLSASREIDSKIGRRFSQESLVELYDGNGTSELAINHYPIIRINYVKITDGSGLELIRTYTPSDLELSDFEAGVLTLKPVAIDNLDGGWQTAASLLYGHIFAQGKSNVEVSYVHGYLEYAEGETLQYLSSTTNGSTGVVSRTYQAINHNWSSNNISVYKNGSLLTSGVSVDVKTGIVTVDDGADDDVITSNYYYTVPYDIATACAKMAAVSIIQQYGASVTGGATGFKNMNYQETYGAQPFSSITTRLQKDADDVIEKYQRFDMYAV